MAISLPVSHSRFLGTVEQVWPHARYGRTGLTIPFENILRLCVELREPAYIEAWFEEHQDSCSTTYVMRMLKPHRFSMAIMHENMDMNEHFLFPQLISYHGDLDPLTLKCLNTSANTQVMFRRTGTSQASTCMNGLYLY